MEDARFLNLDNKRTFICIFFKDLIEAGDLAIWLDL